MGVIGLGTVNGRQGAMRHAREMGRRAGEFLRDYGIPSRCPFTGDHPPTLAREWARGYAEGLQPPQR
jgi:hypothetical protein